jgi:hypothetical protein
MARQELWIHGHSAKIELNRRGRGGGEDINGLQWTAELGLRTGSGVQYRCQDDSDYWFHFAVPSYAMVNGPRARFRRAMVLFTADSGVFLGALHVWDGSNHVFARDGLATGGPNRSPVDQVNSFALPDAEVFFGISISVQFHFMDPATVTLHAAGIEVES